MKQKIKGLPIIPACRDRLGCVNPKSSLSKTQRDNFLFRQILQHEFSCKTRLITKHYSTLKVTHTADSFTRHQLCIFWSQSKHIPSFLPSISCHICFTAMSMPLTAWVSAAPLTQKGDACVQWHKNIITWEHLQHSEKWIFYHFTPASSILLTNFVLPFKLSSVIFVPSSLHQ